MGTLSELEILACIRTHLPGGEQLWDDCGAIPSPPAGQSLLVTTDLLEEGIHFQRDWSSPESLAWKLLAVNLSDLDASGAVPVGFTLTLALPPQTEKAWVERFLRGLGMAAREANLQALGGDTVGRRDGIGLGMTAFGHAARWLTRSGLQVGDSLFVDQPLGASLRGLQKLKAGSRDFKDPDITLHLEPRPRIGLGVELAAMPEVHACMDLSDGLSRDLRSMATASGLSIEVNPDLDPFALQGGEDFARCFGTSLSQGQLEAALGIPLIPVGRAVPKGDFPLFLYDGDSPQPLNDVSFDHFQ